MSVHAELSLVVESCGGQDHTRRERDQRLKAPAIERKILGEGAVNHRADRPRLGVHQRSASFHRDGLRGVAKRHLEVDFESILDVEDHIRLDQLFEAGLFDLEAIGAGREIRQIVFARAVGRGFVTDICTGADGGDFGAGDQGFGWIGDAAGEGGACGLGARKRREPNQEEREDRDFVHSFKLSGQ